VRSANRAARVAERSLLAGLRPLLVPSHLSDEPQKVHFVDGRVLVTPGGGGAAEVGDDAVYLTLSIRNAGSGIAVLDGWRFEAEFRGAEPDAPSEADFRRLTRDLYVAPGDFGFWQGAFRDLEPRPLRPEVAQSRLGRPRPRLHTDRPAARRTPILLRFRHRPSMARSAR
jgi:hypothetical protein